MGLEVLTNDELLQWVRNHVDNLDEEVIALEALDQRYQRLGIEHKIYDSRWKNLNGKMIELLEPFADGPIKRGVKFRFIPPKTMDILHELEKERDDVKRIADFSTS